MGKYDLSLDAEDDVYSISNYIAEDNPVAAMKLVKRLEDACQMLADNPGLGEERVGFGVPGCKSFTVGNYVIFFRPTKSGIDVSRILHGSRDI